MKPLEVIDGVVVGMRYLDETQPSRATSPLRSAAGNLALELKAIPVVVSPALQPREKAWSSIGDVRIGMQCYWRHFVRVADSLDVPVITHLREMYRDAKGLLEAAVFAFRNTWAGPTPNDLKKIFAFCSLSYVVSSMLHARDRFDKTRILAGIDLWFNALENPAEAAAFKQLAEGLWPEEYHHLHFIDLGRDHMTEQAMGAIYSSDLASSYVSESSLGLTPLSDFQSSGFQSPRFSMASSATRESDRCNLRLQERLRGHADKSTDSTDAEQHWQQLAASFPSDLPFSFDPSLSPDTSFSPDLSSITSAQPYYAPIVSPNMVEQPNTSAVPNTTLACINSPEELRDTSVFAAVLQYFKHNESFWYDLSGRGMISKDIRSLLSWNQEGAREKERIHSQLLRYLISEKKTKDATSRGIVTVVEALVEMGYLQSIEEAMNYMTAIGKVGHAPEVSLTAPWADTLDFQSLFSDTGAYGKFISWITPK